MTETVSQPRQLVIVMLPGAMATSIVGPVDIFTQAGQLWPLLCGETPAHHFEVRFATLDRQPLASVSGLSIAPTVSLENSGAPDLILLSSTDISQRDDWHDRLVPWLRLHHERGVPIASIGTGAFVLAEAGLLNGRVGTTHWGFARLMHRQYPDIEVTTSAMVTVDNNLWCCAGVGAYAELCLSLLAHLCGPLVAEQTGRALLLGADRQNPLVSAETRFRLSLDDEMVARVQQHIHAHYPAELTITRLASVGHVMAQTLKRRFKAATGMALMVYVQRTRMDEAARLLAMTDEPVSAVAAAVGYRDVASFRRVFRCYYQCTPNQWREQASMSG